MVGPNHEFRDMYEDERKEAEQQKINLMVQRMGTLNQRARETSSSFGGNRQRSSVDNISPKTPGTNKSYFKKSNQGGFSDSYDSAQMKLMRRGTIAVKS